MVIIRIRSVWLSLWQGCHYGKAVEDRLSTCSCNILTLIAIAVGDRLIPSLFSEIIMLILLSFTLNRVSFMLYIFT